MDATQTHTQPILAYSEPGPGEDGRAQKIQGMVKTLQMAKAKLAESGS